MSSVFMVCMFVHMCICACVQWVDAHAHGIIYEISVIDLTAAIRYVSKDLKYPHKLQGMTQFH